MFKTRLISGCILLLLVFGVMGAGGRVLLGFCLLISLIGLFELYRVFGIEKTLVGSAGYAMAVTYYAILYIYQSVNTLFLMAWLMAFMSIYVFSFPKFEIKNIVLPYFAVLYVPILFSCLYQMRIAEHGIYLVGLVFIGAWGCDTCAYCVGKLLGRHKLAPVLSPKKSIEGAVGGVVGAALLGLFYAFLIGNVLTIGCGTELFCVITSAVTAFFSQVGDLTASAIKRNYGVKDYGTLIPGHGGILDRFDSVLFAAPVVWGMWMILR